MERYGYGYGYVGALLAAALIAMTVTVAAAPAFASSPPIVMVSYGWGTPSSPISVTPGAADVPFTVVLETNGTTTVDNATLNLVEAPITSSTGGQVATAVPQSGSSNLTFYLDVLPSALPGSYTATLNVSYSTSTGGSGYYTDELSLYVSSPPSVRVIGAFWGSGSQAEYPSPGSGPTPFTLVLMNGENYSIGGVVLSLQLPQGIGSSSPVELAVPSMAIGGVEQVTTVLNVTPSASTGPLTAYYWISYMYKGNTYYSNGQLTMYVYPASNLSVDVSAPTAVAGHQAALYVNVTNDGSGAVSDLSVQLESQLQSVSGNSSPLAALQPGASASFAYSLLAPAAPGIYPVQVAISYAYNGQPASSVYYAHVDVVQENGSVSAALIPSTLLYQREESAELLVQNGLSSPIGDVQVSIEPASGIYIGQGYGPFYLGNIPAGGSAGLNLSMISTISQPTAMQLQVVVSYVDQGLQVEQTSTIPLFLNGLITVNFTQVSTSGAAYPGSTVTISGTLLNTGTEEADYGALYLNGSIVQGSQPEYIGNLPTNSPTPFSASFVVPAGTSPGSYKVDVIFTYQGPLGHGHSAAYPVYVTVLSGQPAPTTSSRRAQPYGLYLLIAVIVVVIAVALMWRARRGSRGGLSDESA